MVFTGLIQFWIVICATNLSVLLAQVNALTSSPLKGSVECTTYITTASGEVFQLNVDNIDYLILDRVVPWCMSTLQQTVASCIELRNAHFQICLTDDQIWRVKHLEGLGALRGHFGINAMLGEEAHETILQQATMFIPQLNRLIDLVNPKHEIQKKNINSSYFNSASDPSALELLDLLDRYGSDKGTHHNYHHVYAHVLDSLGRSNPLRLLEIGLGTNNTSVVSNMGPKGRPGASLRAWAEYLPNSEIFGVDVDVGVLFTEGRIRTGFVNQLSEQTFLDVFETFGSQKFDIIIDDGLHSTSANLNTILFALEHINLPGWIIIEDVPDRFLKGFRVIDQIISGIDNGNGIGLTREMTAESFYVTAKHSNMYAIHANKK